MSLDRGAERRLFHLMGSHLGVATRHQAEALGVTRTRLEQLLRHGYIRRIGYGVYAHAASRLDWQGTVMAATLSVKGSVASHRTASALFIEGAPPAPIDLLVARSDCVRPFQLLGSRVVVHLTRFLPARERCRVGPIPATMPARTLLDLAAVERADELDEVLGELLALRRVRADAIEQFLRDPRHRKVRGAPALREALERATVLEVGKTESWAERQFRRLIAAHEIPHPVPQLEIRGPQGGLIGRADFAWPAAWLIVEVDGRRWHSGMRAQRRDRARDVRAAKAGWRTLRFSAGQIDSCPEAVLSELRTVLSGAEAGI